MSLTIEQLRAFTYAAEYGSISEAARQLGKRHSSISELISNLEIELDLQLFDRSRRNATLTEHGQALLREAQATLNSLNNVQDKATALHAGTEGMVTLAYSEYLLSRDYLLEIVHRFSEKFPLVTLELLDTSLDEIYDRVNTGRADIGLNLYEGNITYDGVGYKNAGEISMVRAVGSGHPLAKKNNISNSDLARYIKLYRTTKRNIAALVHKDCADRVIYCSSLSETYHLLENNIGWATLPSHVLTNGLRNGSIVAFDSETQQAEKPQILAVDVLWTNKHILGPASEWLLNKLSKLPKPE